MAMAGEGLDFSEPGLYWANESSGNLMLEFELLLLLQLLPPLLPPAELWPDNSRLVVVLVA